MLTRHAADPDQFLRTLRRALRLSLFIGLPASAGLILTRHDLAAVLYGGSTKSGFSPEGLARSGAVLCGYAPAIWAYSLNHVLTRAWYARGDTMTPTRIAVGMVALNFALSCTLIWFLREAGMAWATSITASVQCAVLLLTLSRRLGTPIADRESAAGSLRLLMVALLMALACISVAWLLPEAVHWREHLLRLALVTGTGIGAYGVLTLLLRAPEPRWLLQRAR